MPSTYSTDIVIFGGGIAGLWLLNRLGQEGYDCLLLENKALGSGQSLASQGIIHGGLKYALSGSLTAAAQAIAAMPARWRDCYAGTGEIDLSDCPILSEHYYMWSDGGVRSKLKTFLGSKSLRGRVAAVNRDDYPAAMAAATTAGSLYRLPDFVIDTAALLQRLASNYPGRVFNYGSLDSVNVGDGEQPVKLVLSHNDNVMEVEARTLVLCAGAGNTALLQQFGIQSVRTQLRPLNMVYLRQEGLPQIYLHCIGSDFSLTPELTVTSHRDARGRTVWYLGGELAEAGVGRGDDEQILAAKQLLQRFLPWVDVSDGDWQCLAINRAEADVGNDYRPDDAYIAVEGRVVAAWPTKLTLAPSLADKLVEHIKWLYPPTNVVTGQRENCLPAATMGRQPWNE